MATRASFPPGDAREDWAILRALSDVLGKRLPYDSLARCAQRCSRPYRIFGADRQIAPGDAGRRLKLAALGGTADKAPFAAPVERLLFHQSDRARRRDDGGMLGVGARRAAMTAAE